jgi:hypothetical protein
MLLTAALVVLVAAGLLEVLPLRPRVKLPLLAANLALAAAVTAVSLVLAAAQVARLLR